MIEMKVTEYDDVDVPGGQPQGPKITEELVAVEAVGLLELVLPL